MRAKILYFAWLREQIGTAEEIIELPPEISNVAELIQLLARRSPNHARAFAKPDTIHVALDHRHASHTAPLNGSAEIAFFPPVTGG